MKKLDLYIIRYFLAALGLTFFSLVGLYVVIHFFTNLSDFIELTQVNIAVFMPQYYFYRLPLILYQITPIILLIATVMTIAKLTRTSELIPIVASGINIYRMMQPILIVAVIFSIAMFIVDEYTVSSLNRLISRTEKILKAEGSELFISRQTKHYNLVMQKYDYVKNIMQNFWVTEYDDEEVLKSKIFARAAQWKNTSVTGDFPSDNSLRVGWHLSDGIVYNYDRRGLRSGPAKLFGAKGYFLHPELTPEIMEKSAEASNESLNELTNLIKQYPQQATFQIKYYNKFSFPLTNFVLIFIGVPLMLTLPTRRNFFRGIGICIAVSLGFFLVKFSLEALCKKDIILPVLASWLPTVAFAIVAVYLWRKMRM